MARSRRFTISTMILAGYVLILLAVVALGWFASSSMVRMQTIAQDLYVHPFAVSNAAAEMKGSLYQLRSHMLQVILVGDRRERLPEMRAQADAFDGTVRKNMAIIETSFLGDMGRVRELKAKLAQWAEIRAMIFTAAENGDHQTAERLVKTAATATFAEIVPSIDYILSFALDRGRRFADEAEARSADIVFQLRVLVILLAVFIAATGLAVLARVTYLQRELRRQATMDFLTGMPNRQHFMDLADHELARSQRYGDPLSLAIADLDFFKAVNDAFGHGVGDQVLRRFSAVCAETLREADIVGRIGGEEFAFVLPGTTLPIAREVIERVRKAIEAIEVDTGQPAPLRITASFGLTAFAAGDEHLAMLLKRADHALYDAKHSGRNTISAR